MFCPEDCVHIHEVEQNCASVARQLLPFRSGLETVFDPETDQIDFEKSRGERRRILEGMIFQDFLNRHVHSALAVSPAGDMRRLGMHAIRPPIYNQFQQYDSTFFIIGTDLLFVDMSTGTIDTLRMAERWAKAEVDGCSDWWWEISELLKPLTGWAVCFKREEVKYSVAEIRSAWESRKAEVDDRKGRPRIQERVLAAYHSSFPNGHTGTSWKHVQSLLSKTIGEPVSVDTIRRSLGLRK